MQLDRKNLIISLILVFVLILPLGIGMMHAFHQHENQYCHAENESHIHAEASDCSHLHYFNQTLHHNFLKDDGLNFSSWFIEENALIVLNITITFPITDLDRGPPVIMTF